ncbi:hypothetical protein QAD02_010534 [Eretmocerus hayati]|uniref:Uncharacterized protein n=1 Tax=Eretmocerus hayati TaxID=131215 RepID=A0ACC2NV50_9HYME|nr:hypothetical protein QAD02_010534 [Eretmocerus hayati]
MKSILALTICLVSACAGMNVPDSTTSPDVGTFDTDYFGGNSINNTYPEIVQLESVPGVLNYLHAPDILELITDSEAGRPLEICKIVRLLNGIARDSAEYGVVDENSYIQDVLSRWPEEHHAELLSKINQLPRCNTEDVFTCEHTVCEMKRNMMIAAMGKRDIKYGAAEVQLGALDYSLDY